MGNQIYMQEFSNGEMFQNQNPIRPNPIMSNNVNSYFLKYIIIYSI